MRYLWRFLAYHLHGAGRPGELAALTCDLRWVEAKTRRFGSAVGVQADLELADDTPTTTALQRTLGQSAHLLGPLDPPAALGATLASRVHGVPGLEALLDHYQATLPRPRLEPAWPLPDRADPNRPAAAFASHIGGVYSCAYSPDGTLLATASDDGTARLWHVASRTVRAVLTGHIGPVSDCAFSPCTLVPSLLATASSDGTVRLWDVATYTTQAVLVHPDSVTSCAFSPQNIRAGWGGDRGDRIMMVTLRAITTPPSLSVIIRPRLREMPA